MFSFSIVFHTQQWLIVNYFHLFGGEFQFTCTCNMQISQLRFQFRIQLQFKQCLADGLFEFVGLGASRFNDFCCHHLNKIEIEKKISIVNSLFIPYSNVNIHISNANAFVYWNIVFTIDSMRLCIRNNSQMPKKCIHSHTINLFNHNLSQIIQCID